MEKLPFCEQIKNGWNHRIFKSDLNDEDLKWHYDEEDRLMVTTHQTDWMFQYDNQLPFIIELHRTYTIPKGQYHRLIKGTEDLEVKILKLIDGEDKISKNLQYHLDNNLSIENSIFRIGSDAWCDLINEIRELYFEGRIELNKKDIEVIITNAGKKDYFEGELVPLDAPFPLNETDYAVFVRDDDYIVKKVVFK
jgi:hypothetical protein